MQDTEDSFWSGSRNSAVYIADAETLMRKILYVIGNSVTSFLTDKAREWPGFRTLPKDLCSLRAVVERPKVLFGGDGTLPPKKNRLRLYLPDFPGLSNVIGARVTAKSFRSYLKNELSKLEAKTRKQRGQLRIKVVGRQAVLAASPFDTPKGRKFKVLPMSPEGKSVRISPRIATRDRVLQKKLLKWLKKFSKAYANARGQLNNYIAKAEHGMPTFPYGTYQLKESYGVECEELPPDFPVEAAFLS